MDLLLSYKPAKGFLIEPDYPSALVAKTVEIGAPVAAAMPAKVKSGKIIRRSRWTIAEQLPVLSFRLSKRRLAPGERADGVVVFDRPPYKQSNETLFSQIAEAGPWIAPPWRPSVLASRRRSQ